MIVIRDTSCIGYLMMIGKLSLLKENFTQIIIPEAVYNELLPLFPEYNVKGLRHMDWIRIISIIDRNYFDILFQQLDEGESEAIVLCKEMKADLLLMDERKGTAIARSLGINTIGILGVLLLSKKKGIINFVRPLLNKLINNTTFRISKDIYKKILQEANEQ